MKTDSFADIKLEKKFISYLKSYHIIIEIDKSSFYVIIYDVILSYEDNYKNPVTLYPTLAVYDNFFKRWMITSTLYSLCGIKYSKKRERMMQKLLTKYFEV